MSDLAVQNRESEQEVMPSFDFLLERETERNTLLRNIVPGYCSVC